MLISRRASGIYYVGELRLTKPSPTPCMKKSGRCSKSSRSPTSSSERREEKESPRLWMMLLVRSSSALLHGDLSRHDR